HDLCAQLHVLQFCLDELDSFISPEGKEYLKRMTTSTRYISSLVDSFRKGLKVNLSDEIPYAFDEVYEPAIELIKNHYFVILERVSFSIDMPKTPVIKSHGRTLMSVLFGIYSVFLDELKAREDELSQMNFNLSIKDINPRFTKVSVLVDSVELDDKGFLGAMEKSAPSKGKMRQFLGLNSLKELAADESSSFKVSREGCSTRIEFAIPLVCNEKSFR
ncbi:MAG: hypothetical protein NXH75_18145, partial [Halobacteriovoraceae bacterium]|nr:hypothetical protein [Halobacteriovoraceae bacterium]